MKQLISSLTISLILVFGTFGTLPSLYPNSMTVSIASAAPGETYCVVSQSGMPGSFAVCTRVFTSLQAAADMATGGEKILVATTRYTEIQARSNLTQVVYLSKTVQLQGGYNDDFTVWDPALYPTTLDAQGQGRVLYATGPISITIEDVEITGGKAAGLAGGERSGFNDDAGGGVYLNGVTVTLRNNRIYHNLVNDGATLGNPDYFGTGGAMYLANGTALLENNAVYENIALTGTTDPANSGTGGGLYFYQSDVVLQNNRLYSNTANAGTGGEGVGGGLFVLSSTVTLSNNLIYSNVACVPGVTSGCALAPGGGAVIGNSQATLVNNRILSNTAMNPTGNIALGGGIAFDSSQVTLTDNLIQGNTAAISSTASASCGGIILLSSQAFVQKNLLRDNVAGGYGGGLCLHESQAFLRDNLFRDNTAASVGGGLNLYRSQATLTNSVFVANRAITAGAGLAVSFGSAAHLRHTTFNDRDLSGSDIQIGDGGDSGSGPFSTLSMTNTILVSHTLGISVTAGNTLTLNSILWHNTPITVSAGTTATVLITRQISGDPAFASDGYHLMPGSAAIGNGISAGVATDIDSEPRRVTPDLGADEYWLSPPTDWLYLPLLLKSHTK